MHLRNEGFHSTVKSLAEQKEYSAVHKVLCKANKPTYSSLPAEYT